MRPFIIYYSFQTKIIVCSLIHVTKKVREIGKSLVCHVTFTYKVTRHSYDIIYDPMLLVDWKNVRNKKNHRSSMYS